jgi:DNA-binding NarL/FixJ family response regulator
MLLSLEDGLEVVGDAGSVQEALVKTTVLQPDLIVTDLSMAGSGGVSGVTALRNGNLNAKIAVLTVHNTPEYIRASLAAGADGYIVKESNRAELLDSLRRVMQDKFHLCARSSAQFVRTALGREIDGSVDDDEGSVTSREREILVLVAKGHSNKVIARALSRSVKTVEKHRANLMRKLNLHNVADVTRYAIQNGLLSEDGLASDTQDHRNARRAGM